MVDTISIAKPVKIQPVNLDGTLHLKQNSVGELQLTIQSRGLVLSIEGIQGVTLDGQDGTAYHADWIALTDAKSHISTRSGVSSELVLSVPSIRLVESTEDATTARTLTVLVCGCFFAPPSPMDFNVAGFHWRVSALHSPAETTDLLSTTNGTAITARFDCALEPGQSASEAENVAEDLMWMLRLGDARPNHWCRTLLLDSAGQVVWTEYRSGPLPGRVSAGPLPYDPNNPVNTKKFLEGCYAAYKANKEPYRLQGIIHMLALARAEAPTEIKALIASNILEIIRYNYGVNVLAPSGRAFLDGDDICRPSNRKRMSLNELIVSLCNDLSLSGWSTDFKDLRNSVTHQGVVPGASPKERYYNTMDLIHFIDRVTLALLGVDQLGLNYYRCNIREGHNDWIVPFVR
ncbi:hypothetical protein WMF45_34380 [Sorangium sp. So ce448]|uniref:hypothetical protein n=1 Tax=Sorangium sp. So ce448 TaxID=3133314 RepID=UPI003F609240